MASVDVELQPPRRRSEDTVELEALRRDLESRVDGEVRFDAGSRGAYATDASNYRQVPIGVVVPHSVDAGVEAVAVCREHGAPLLSRGGGTSLGGQATNAAIVLDWTKYCHRLLSVDPDNRTCVVEPGIVLDDLNAQLAPYGLEFGPRPSTHSHCALGGMIGNNSCGATAQWSGKTDENVVGLEMLTYDGLRCWVGRTGRDDYERVLAEGGRRAELYRGLAELAEQAGDLVRERFPTIPRRVSGYNLDALLPEQEFDLAGLVVGSEGTLATVLHAELALMPVLEYTTMLVLGYDDIVGAAHAVPDILHNSEPTVLEGVDDRLIYFEKVKRLSEEARQMLPEGAGWLLVQFGAPTREAANEQAEHLLDALGRSRHHPRVNFSDDTATEQEIWAAREAGLGATARPPDMSDTWPGWEDSAVAPERLGDYLSDLRELFREYNLGRPSLYGHFGQGCVHVRIPFDLVTADGLENFTRFVQAAADLVADYGGSLSGEHGDGQARGPLLERMFGSEVVRLFERVKTLFDPDNRMNPGKVVASYRVDENLRLGTDWHPEQQDTYFGYPHDEGSFGRAAMRCVGIGNCRSSEQGQVMCPSYKATGEEEHSTRGRARLLYEMLNGHGDGPVTDGWRSKRVRDALDLCLACKGCKSDCPVNVDMATYKAEFLAHHYRGRVRPAAHYSMGWLPLWARLSEQAPKLVNAVLHAPGLARLGKRVAGITPEREAPLFTDETVQQWWRRRTDEEPDPAGPRTVVVWPDTFTNHFHPHIGRAAVHVLEAAGFDVVVPQATMCCGLTWISTGQLATARRVLRRTSEALRPWLEAGTPIVTLEPSCTAVFRSDAPEMMPADQDVARLADQAHTLAELLVNRTPQDWQPPQLSREAVVQTHCHQHATVGFDPDTEIMRRAGLDVHPVSGGCCGVAGNFGFEKGHYDISMQCAEEALLPAMRKTTPETLIIADGFSCRTQIEQAGTGRTAMHLAEALHLGLVGDTGGPYPERGADRPAANRTAEQAATAVTTVAAGSAVVGLGGLLRRKLSTAARLPD
ncbi:FAD-binding and (Fe-S)-binding domain-containing protein [Haloactinomyces albus]|uniref:FAD/FMN-containing dehydrogenase/Fe-S oxidoreductase n=1 Tax=Haloactinomyces albus TaxID=1352928 RepID=A0AAE4CKD5_9ACTN|nr:FAD-linked oxidase C-terminal domain-containing protein [Haloactinomyces albus]MDR7300221.1 FAD/FMN-containing dehydrogenase/Fe-S oxidoreductase [Haloactinomyces albus]